jgi:hypothetical protein
MDVEREVLKCRFAKRHVFNEINTSCCWEQLKTLDIISNKRLLK